MKWRGWISYKEEVGYGEELEKEVHGVGRKMGEKNGLGGDLRGKQPH